MDRKSASFKTALTGIILNLIATVLGFITQRIFINTLGVEYTGINGTYGNILSILTLSDLGVGVAVIYHLYGALAKNDKKRIAALMHFYHKACRIVAGVVLLGGAALLPFAKVFVGENNVPDNLYIIFGLYVIIASLQYILNYRRALLSADQRGYVINTVMIGATTILYFVKIAVLLITGNFYLYAIAIIIEKLAENLIINHIVKKRYPYILEPAKLEKSTRTDIKKKMYASIYHNSASYVVNFTDNTIIAQFFGAAQVGLYVNYYMIVSAINTLIAQVFNGVVASLGNILAAEGHNRLYPVTKSIFFLNFWIYAVVSIATYFCLPSFVAMWIGPEYWLPNIVVAAVVLNMFVQGMRFTANNTLSVGGIIFENRFVPVMEAVINLTTSIILGKLIGMAGIFIGTILSNLFLHIYSYPKYAFGLVLKRKRIEYIGLFTKYLAIFLISWLGMSLLFKLVVIDNNFAQFLLNGFLSIVIPSLCYWVIFHRTEEYRYVSALLKEYFKKFAHRLARIYQK
ncbi:hypothetical protein IKF76_01270 [Candidatus Saccharibacteria bacterium]|nr:hypothetical protein [Candidatus Saccharibacteria bacterium]